MENRPVHGGAVWSIVDDDIKNLGNFVAADVADAWYPPAPDVIKNLHEALKYVQWAPDTWGDRLREEIASHLTMSHDAVVVDAGSSPLIERMLRAVLKPKDSIIIVAPTYSEYEAIAVRCGADVSRLPLLPAMGLRCEVDQLLSLLDGTTRAVVLCNPNNPTGQAIARKDLVRLAESLPDRVALLVDEVYGDYAPDCSVLRDAATHPFLAVIRSFSKTHALAGLRVGFATVGYEMVRILRMAGEVPWRVSLLADIAARRALKNFEYVQERIAETVMLRDDLQKGVSLIKGCQVVPSQTNFFLVQIRGTGLQTQHLANLLKAKGILIKAVAPWLGEEDSGFIRITTRSANDNYRTLEALQSVIRQ